VNGTGSACHIQHNLEANGLASHRWAIILAAGDGARVRALTTDGTGGSQPKQFWSPGNDGPMIRWTLRRAGRLASTARIVTVVAAQHLSYWKSAFPAESLARVVVQPANRGTAAGVLLPLLHVFQSDPDATVVILPADHAVEDEDILMRALLGAFDLVERGRPVVLLGMTPDLPDPSYGWVVSGEADEDGSRPVMSFQEKPAGPRARDLYLGGAHWSSFILVAQARALLSIYERIAPALLRSLSGAHAGRRHATSPIGDPDSGALERAYSNLPSMDFSRDLLERAASELRLLVVPPCGWTDLGTPDRIERWMETRTAGCFESAGAGAP
jgi:mannose-1-phosphate guanylyltransferase